MKFRTIFRLLFSLLIINLLILSPVLAEGQIIIKIPEQVTVTGKQILLKDLGTVENCDPTDMDTLYQIKLGAAPLPGKSKVIKRSYLEFILKQYRFHHPAQLVMPEEVLVKLEAVLITAAMIKERIKSVLPPPKPAILNRQVEYYNLPEQIWLAKAGWRIEAAPVGPWPDQGPVLIRVELTNGVERKVINLKAKIRSTALVFKTKRIISHHSQLTAADFEMVEAELVTGREITGEFPEGIRSATTLKPGQILQISQVEPVPLISKNSAIKVVITDHHFQIEMTGIAKEDGWLGDTITILNPVSKKTFQGKVTGLNIAEVSLP